MNADELRAAIDVLPPLPKKNPAFTWPAYRASLRNDIKNSDLSRFLAWPTVVVAMFVGNKAACIPHELEALTPRYLDILSEPRFGDPQIMKTPGGIITSGNLIHQAYHLMQFEAITGVRVDELASIVEFGGGYGAMCLLCHRLGFAGTYTIIDLPEINLLQRYYLSNVSDIEIETTPPKSCDLFMAICSITEVLIAERGVLPRAKHHLFYYAPQWGDMDNKAWLKEVMRERLHNDFVSITDTNRWYLID